ncbi:hypothetical protein GCM10027168_26290 [Streptomyces capparidis]
MLPLLPTGRPNPVGTVRNWREGTPAGADISTHRRADTDSPTCRSPARRSGFGRSGGLPLLADWTAIKNHGQPAAEHQVLTGPAANYPNVPVTATTAWHAIPPPGRPPMPAQASI